MLLGPRATSVLWAPQLHWQPKRVLFWWPCEFLDLGLQSAISVLMLYYLYESDWTSPYFSLTFLFVCPQLFSHILKREFHESHTKHLSRKFTEWVYGPVTCSLYDLASVDSYEDNSVVEILVYSSDIPVSAGVMGPVRAAAAVIVCSNICLLLSPLRTATRCSPRSLWAGCWIGSGRCLQAECSSWTSWSTSCTWSSSLLWLTIRRKDWWAGCLLQTVWLICVAVPDRPALMFHVFFLRPTAAVSPRTQHNGLPVCFRPACDRPGKLLFLFHRGM